MSDGFLGRWSRRKIEAKVEAKIEGDKRADPPRVASDEPGGAEGGASLDAASPAAVIPDEPQAERDEALSEEEIAALPPIESFTLETDITPFLRRGVPKALKNAAMRRMWLLDPAIRNYRDVALDYAYDWNVPGGVPGNAGSITREATRRMLDALTPKLPATNEPTRDEPASDMPVGGEAAIGEGAVDRGPATASSAQPDESAAARRHGDEEAEEPVRAEARGPAASPRAAPPTGASEPEGASEIARRISPHYVEEAPETALRKRRHGKATPV